LASQKKLPQLRQSRLQSSPTSQKELQMQSAEQLSSSSLNEQRPSPQSLGQSDGQLSRRVQTLSQGSTPQSAAHVVAVSLSGSQ